MKNPIQPLVEVNGIIRFKENAIVRHLLDFASSRGCDLNAIAVMDFSADDRMQFAQLIGYSLDGFGTLGYVSNEVYEAATTMANFKDERDARLTHYENLINNLKQQLRGPMADLFEKHPDDFCEHQVIYWRHG